MFILVFRSAYCSFWMDSVAPCRTVIEMPSTRNIGSTHVVKVVTLGPYRNTQTRLFLIFKICHGMKMMSSYEALSIKQRRFGSDPRSFSASLILLRNSLERILQKELSQTSQRLWRSVTTVVRFWGNIRVRHELCVNHMWLKQSLFVLLN